MSKPKINETIVIEIQSDYVIVMDPGGKIHRLKRKDGLEVGDHIYYLEDDRYPFEKLSKSKVKQVNFRPFIGLALMAALVFIFFNITWSNSPSQASVEAVLSIGSEDGIQIELGENQEVLRVINQLGEEIDADISLGDAFEETSTQLVQILELSDNNDILVAISGSTPEESALLEQSFLEVLELRQAEKNIVIIKGDLQDYENALNNKTLLGNYQLSNAGLELWTQEEGQVLTAKEKEEYLSGQADYYQFDSQSESLFQKWLKEVFDFSELKKLLNNLLEYQELNSNLHEGDFDDSDSWYDSFYQTEPTSNNAEPAVFDDNDWDDDDLDYDDWEDDWDDDDDDWDDDWDDDLDDD